MGPEFDDLSGAISRAKNKWLDEGDALVTNADMFDIIWAAHRYLEDHPEHIHLTTQTF